MSAIWQYPVISLVERNVHGAWVVWGQNGIRQYYGYSKSEAMQKYRNECLNTNFCSR